MRLFHRSGFTLIETLIVVAILTVLASIVFVLAGPNREKARQTVCANQMRQIHQAWLMYSDDSDASEEVEGIGSLSMEPIRNRSLLFPYLKDETLWYCPDTPNDLRGKFGTTYWWYVAPAWLWPDPTPAEQAALDEQRKEIMDSGQKFPLLICRVHDEVYYLPQEEEVHPAFQQMFVLELRLAGNVFAGRKPYARGYPLRDRLNSY